jgi:hypothetical protein
MVAKKFGLLILQKVGFFFFSKYVNIFWRLFHKASGHLANIPKARPRGHESNVMYLIKTLLL